MKLNCKEKIRTTYQQRLCKVVQVIDMTTETSISDRITYASFPAHLKAAMKIAARNYGWDRATWAMQTQMIQDAMLSGRDTDDNIAARYGAPKQPCPWGEPKETCFD